jgi:hypothetical protein
MRKLVALLIAIAFVASAIPAFAGCGTCGTKAGEKAAGEQSLFQKMSDTMKPGPGLEKNKYRKVEKIYLFQSLADGIKEGSAKAKSGTLRTQK